MGRILVAYSSVESFQRRERVLKRIAKYELERVLGEGAFGATYVATDTVTGELVALKVFKNAQLALDEFQNEARALMMFSHPNIICYKDCNYFDVGSGRRLFYLATEFAESGSLKGKAGEVQIATGVDYVLQILAGLVECHRHHRLHCDLKPDNVFLSRGRAKIGDFGISLDTTKTINGHARGTPRYMAPEQFQSGRLSRRTDIWSVGVMLFEFVYGGRHPFPDRRDFLNPSAEAHCRPVAQFPKLDDVIRRALTKNESLRFQTAAAFLEALQQCSRLVLKNIMKAEQGIVGWEYDGNAYDYREFEVALTAGFKKPPIIQFSIQHLDATPTNEGDRTTRYWIEGEVPTPDRAKIKVGTWCNNKLMGCRIRWLALGE